jgi:hypothetical protein
MLGNIPLPATLQHNCHVYIVLNKRREQTLQNFYYQEFLFRPVLLQIAISVVLCLCITFYLIERIPRQMRKFRW